jgi:hypothetical protein
MADTPQPAVAPGASAARPTVTPRPSTRAKRRLIIRVGLMALAIPDVVVGIWLLFASKSFYDSFPGFGHRWVGPLGPYDQHAFSDFGGALLALGLLACLAALWMERRLMQAALLAVLLQSAAHFVYHLTRLGSLPTGDDIANQLSLAYGVVLSLLLLWLTRALVWPSDDPAVGQPGAEPKVDGAGGESGRRA